MNFLPEAHNECTIDTIYKAQISLFLSIRTSIIFHIPSHTRLQADILSTIKELMKSI
jgi:hypothetical protein